MNAQMADMIMSVIIKLKTSAINPSFSWNPKNSKSTIRPIVVSMTKKIRFFVNRFLYVYFFSVFLLRHLRTE